MRRKLILLLALCALTGSVLADEFSDTVTTFKTSPVAQSLFDSAYAYAVFPTIAKGGVGLGAAHGTGRVFRAGAETGTTSMTQLSIGLQMGGQAYSQVIFLKDQRAYDEFASGNFEFAAGASAIAITASAQATASTTGVSASTGAAADSTKQASAYYNKGMAVLTVAKGGLMYEATIAGQRYDFSPL